MIKIEAPGTYKFALTSDDASQLVIDDDKIASNDIKTPDAVEAATGEGQLLHAKEVCMYAYYLHTYIHTYIHTYVHTYIRTYIHTS